ncbi:MAG: GtrA family protein [Clostridia bacterium]|nr:GtrA family protein [Clostridia bacterium]
MAQIINLVKRLIKKYKAVVLYLIFGVLTTILNIVTYWLLSNVLNIYYMVSNIVAWCLAIAVAYLTNRVYVFNSDKIDKKGILKEIAVFISVRLSSLAVDVIIMYIGVSLLQINDMIIKIFANFVVIVINYIMSKKIVFKNKT